MLPGIQSTAVGLIEHQFSPDRMKGTEATPRWQNLLSAENIDK